MVRTKIPVINNQGSYLKMGSYFLTDIDLTLLQGRRWIKDDTDLTPAALDNKGDVYSFFTPQQRSLMALLKHADQVIPVTARNSEALSRVLIPFSGFKVVSHGALILGPENELLPEWLADNQVLQWSCRLQAAYGEISARLDALNETDLRHWIVEDHDMPVYIAIKGDAQILDKLAVELRESWCMDGALLHHNGREMALLPPFARKEKAVAFLMAQIRQKDPHALFIGAGDSKRDLPFMRLCDYMMVPASSQAGAGL